MTDLEAAVKQLVDLYREREEHDPLRNIYWYLAGRADQLCIDAAIPEPLRTAASAAARQELRAA